MAEEFSRRPLKSRNVKVFRDLAVWLAGCGVSANMISAVGMGLGLAAGAALVATRFVSGPAAVILWLLAALLVQGRLLGNLLDGLVAIEGGKRSRTGPLWNEIPDRVSDTAALVGAGYAAGSVPELGFVATLLAMLTAYIRAIGAANGAGEAFEGMMSKPKRMFVLTVACFAGAFGGASVAMPVALGIIVLGSAITCFQRLGKISNRLP